MVILTTNAEELDTYQITIEFTDLDGDAVIPNAITYTLARYDGTVVNSREDVSLTPASSIDFILTGDDLQIFDDDKEDLYRYVHFEGNYTDGSTTCYINRVARFEINKTADFFE